MSPTTFKVSKENPDPIQRPTQRPTSICSQSQGYGKMHCKEILMESQYPPTVEHSSVNGFVCTVMRCYNLHHNLIIRPDDVWLAIVTQFSYCINRKTGEFRNKLVNFEGKKNLSVTIDNLSRPYDLFITKMTEKIGEIISDKGVKDWILPKFSTTTTTDIISSGVAIMATTKKYFQPECRLQCGIPNITIEGTLYDWECILGRLEKLKEYKLDKWYGLLKPIIQEFIVAKKEKPNIKFWDRICHRLGGASGPSHLSGWLTVFCPYDEDGNWADVKSPANQCLSCGYICNHHDEPWPVIDIANIASGIVNIDIKLIDSGGCEHDCIMFAGHVGYNALEDDYTLQPHIGWALAEKSSAEEIEKLHEACRGGVSLFLWRIKF